MRQEASSPPPVVEEAAPPPAETGGGCPMKTDGSYSFDWSALWNPAFPHGPGGSKPITREDAERMAQEQSKAAAEEESSGCPVKKRPQQYNVYSQPIDPKNNMPSTANQLPAPGQSEALSTNRIQSSIPKGAADEGTTWTYPSPQMFYNALARKGKLGDTTEQDMDSLVALHNHMNEKTWKQVVEFERVLGYAAPQLLKFLGRPSDLSPKAALKHYVLGHPLPYDRHDWTVLREDGATVRYVIDYYHDESRAREDAASAQPQMHDTEATPSLLVDVRPALDGPGQFFGRALVMPYALMAGSTSFTPLNLAPTATMKSQVMDSVKIWDNIQAAVRDVRAATSAPRDLSESEIRQLAQSFDKAVRDCKNAKRKLEKSRSEQDMAQASMDLTICTAKVVCPVQHGSLLEALTSDREDTIEAAFSSVAECVALKSEQLAEGKAKYNI